MPMKIKACFLMIFAALAGSVSAGDNVYRRVLDAPPTVLDPIYTDNGDEIQIIRQLFDQLVTYDQRLQLKPLLAQQWDVSPDGLKYVFHIRKGIKFSDGSPLGIDDVIISLSRAIGDPASLFYRDFYMVRGAQEYREGRAKSVAGIKHVNDSVEITLNKPSPYLLSVLASSAASIVRKKAGVGVGGSLIGTGPFVLKCVGSNGVALVANQLYFRGAPKLSGVTYSVYKSKDRMYADFIDGRLEDIAPYPLPAGTDAKRFTRIFTNGIISFILAINPEREPVSSEHVRQALATAIDFDAIFKDLHSAFPTLERTRSYIPKGRPGYLPGFQGLRYDLKKARELIKKAGYKDFSDVPPVTLYYSGNLPYSRELVEGMRRGYSEIGLNFSAKQLTTAENIAEARSGKWTMQMIGLDTLYPDSYYMVRYFHSRASDGFIRCKDPAVDSLIEQLETEVLAVRRQELLNRLNVLITEKAYVIPLYSGDTFDGTFQKWVSGIQYPHTAYFDLKLYPVKIDEKSATGRKEKDFVCHE